jgi:4-hydroxy-tetrahydrodipicolinate reductase
MTAIRKFKLGILGFSGRMGAEVEKLLQEPRFAARLEKNATPARGESIDSLFEADLWLDFSSPNAVLALVREAVRRKSKIPLVVGSTGWSASERNELEAAAKSFPILQAANFSLGAEICRIALGSWRTFPELARWKITIRERHHPGKKDAPSGTALSLREALGREVEIESIREGDFVGVHEVIAESAHEKLTFIHEAKSRAVFAEGALEAALRLGNSEGEVFPKRILGLDDLYLHRGA